MSKATQKKTEETVQGPARSQRVDTHAAAQRGVAGAASTLPYAAQIQRSFGRHDVSGVRAQVGGAATEAATSMGAAAYARGDQIGFGQAPSLRIAAHEAAHVVQQRSGVSVSGGVGAAGDRYEQHADAVADLVVRGQSAEGLLGTMTGGRSAATTAIQCTPLADQIRTAQAPMAADTRWETEDDGTLRENDPLMRSAHHNPSDVAGTQFRARISEELQSLSQAFHQVQPALQAWGEAMAAVQTVSAAGGLNPASRSSLNTAREAVGHMGDQMHNPQDRVGARMSETLERHSGTSAQSIEGAVATVRGAMSGVMEVRQELEAYRERLRQASLQEERGEIQARIDSAIRTVTQIISAATRIAGTLTGSGSALAQSLSVANTTAGTGVGGSVAEAIAGVFVDIDGMNGQIRALDQQIASSEGAVQRLDTGRLIEANNRARQELTAARGEVQHLSSTYMNGLGRAGRIYDLQGRSQGEAAQSSGPTPRSGETHSVEAILSLVAALQSRRHARTIFGDVLERNPILRGPRSRMIIQDFLRGDMRHHPVPTTRDESGRPAEYATVPVPMNYEGRQGGGSPFTEAERARCQDLLRMSGNVWQSVDHYERVHAREETNEAAWLEMAGQATHGRVH